MPLLISDTFTSSLARLTDAEQKSVKTTAFDLQMNPSQPGMQFHRLDRAKDRNFWSVRVSSDIRLIVHKTDHSLMLCYVDHHDAAYNWAERRKIEVHPSTGAAQLVEIRETVREIEVPRYVDAPVPRPAPAEKPKLFADRDDETLLGYGVPMEWLADVRAANEDTLLDLVTHLPGEAAEALLALATGGTPKAEPALSAYWLTPGQKLDETAAALVHPDAQRRFRVVDGVDELARALDSPWDKWAIFLHPAQERLARLASNGPTRVSGSAGTGKTVVALHRAAFLAQKPRARVLLTTFNDTLATALTARVERLLGEGSEALGRVTVRALDRVALDLFEEASGAVARLSTREDVAAALGRALDALPSVNMPLRFLEAEWHEVVDAWQLTSWDAYRDVRRLGRKTRLSTRQREEAWTVFERLWADLASQGKTTMAGVCGAVRQSPFTHIVVDEAQDLSVAQLRFLARLTGNREDGLFFAGDLGQRIFQTPFSWKSLGVDVRGRSHTLRVNYRTSHQIRRQADRLLPGAVADVDGNSETRGAVSVFNGPEPEVVIADSVEAERYSIAAWLKARLAEGVVADEIAVFVRSDSELARARGAVEASGLKAAGFEVGSARANGGVAVGTMHLAKGLEFRAVVVAGCDDDVLPLQSRIVGVTDEADLEDVYNTERHLLYVACTRARDHLLVTGVRPGSEFLGDLKSGEQSQ